jgi:hypothetical protein
VCLYEWSFKERSPKNRDLTSRHIISSQESLGTGKFYDKENFTYINFCSSNSHISTYTYLQLRKHFQIALIVFYNRKNEWGKNKKGKKKEIID